MGYIDGMEDVMQMETAMLQHTMAYVKKHCAPEIALLDVDVPRIGAIPCIQMCIRDSVWARLPPVWARYPSSELNFRSASTRSVCASTSRAAARARCV